jgi:hypothetical protein
MANDKKAFVADDGISTVPGPVTPEGGVDKSHDKKKKETVKSANVKTPGQEGAGKPVPTAEEFETEEEVVVESSIASIFEGEEFSEEFKNKIALVFEAAVNEEVSNKTLSIQEEIEQVLEEELNEAIEARMSEIVENVDKYLDYVVGAWMEENEVAIESGIKVEIAESLMNGLKTLFAEHNVEVDEDTVDIVSVLEQKVQDLEESANDLVNENIELHRNIVSIQAEKVFEEMTEGLSENQKERFKILSEKLDIDDLYEYSENLQVIKESFFGEAKVSAPKIGANEEDEIILEEQEVSKPASDYTSINALVEAFNTRKKNN